MIDLDRREQLAWASGTANYGVADLATTAAGLTLGAVELSPVGPATLAEWGLADLLVHKLAALCLFGSPFLLRRRFGRRIALGVPIGLALLGRVIGSLPVRYGPVRALRVIRQKTGSRFPERLIERFCSWIPRAPSEKSA